MEAIATKLAGMVVSLFTREWIEMHGQCDS